MPKPAAPAKPPRRVLDAEVWCPFSGIKGCTPHKISLMVCANGTLYAYCSHHVTRVFVSDPNTIQQILKEASVITVPRTKPEENRGKEKLNAP